MSPSALARCHLPLAMTSPPDPPPPASFFGRQAALALASVFLGGMVVLAGLGAISRSHLAGLEHFEEMTGFGDSRYFQIPPESSDPQARLAVVTLKGVPLSLVSTEKFEIRDTRMLRAGRDPATALAIYSLAEGADRKETGREKTKGKRSYYLKAGPEQYLKLEGLRPLR